MLFSKNRIHIVSSPRVGILDLGGDETKAFVQEDVAFLKPLFADLRRVDLAAPTCDVLFLYAELTPEGAITGSPNGLREIIRDSGAKVVVVASPNPGGSYVKAGKQQPYGRANLVMTLNRRGTSFSRFLAALFAKMKRGTSMPVAWVELNPQVPGRDQSDSPETIFACEIGPLAFS
ncbi:MAG TPA: hypothetical protein VG944_15090 [Fimbriimonas sp.]|nr:hypothetical protein [Fimbriimonas sp.]